MIRSGGGAPLGCTVAAVSAQWPVEHVKNALQNIVTDRMPHSVQKGVAPAPYPAWSPRFARVVSQTAESSGYLTGGQICCLKNSEGRKEPAIL